MPNVSALFARLAMRSIASWAWLCLLVTGLASIASVQAQSYSFRDYAQADGLQGMTITGLVEDRRGVVWVATELALHRFERERFIAVGQDQGLDARFTRGLTLDSAGRLWVATANGVFVRDGEQFVQMLREGKRIRADAGNVIAAYRDGVAVISAGALLAVTPGAGKQWQG
ncbi:two-component regulator propeller domain-containing protein, partial [Xanthomonas hortorum]|uniref:two-component regulator propeller domain-containing protein n=1 Tax=Xanthomonas hortorum TaxID=56454 RepID=UPI002FE15C84